MTDDQAALTNFSGVARLFPLPNLVLFPTVIQGLHIFEPRYRQMMADTLAGDTLMALALLKPGWDEDYDGKPAIEPVVCLGRVTSHEKLPDGRYNLRLRGLSRARVVEEIRTDTLYRTARLELLPDITPDDLSRLSELRRKLRLAVLPQFAPTGPAQQQLKELFHGDMPLGQLCDVLSYALPLPLEFKQQLLAEPHADLRAELLTEMLAPPAPAAAADDSRRFPPDFSPN